MRQGSLTVQWAIQQSICSGYAKAAGVITRLLKRILGAAHQVLLALCSSIANELIVGAGHSILVVPGS
jgi:hypothetical protein